MLPIRSSSKRGRLVRPAVKAKLQPRGLPRKRKPVKSVTFTTPAAVPKKKNPSSSSTPLVPTPRSAPTSTATPTEPVTEAAESGAPAAKPRAAKRKDIGEHGVLLLQTRMRDFLHDNGKGEEMESTKARKKNMPKKKKSAKDKKKQKPKPPVIPDVAVQPLAPTVTLDADGKITLNTQSIVYQPKVAKPDHNAFEDMGEDRSIVTSRSFKESKQLTRWNNEETKLFYKLLRQCGSDFTMISQMFPRHTRAQVKRKFKKEEREHAKLVEWAMDKRCAIPLEDLTVDQAAVATAIVDSTNTTGTTASPSSTAPQPTDNAQTNDELISGGLSTLLNSTNSSETTPATSQFTTPAATASTSAQPVAIRSGSRVGRATKKKKGGPVPKSPKKKAPGNKRIMKPRPKPQRKKPRRAS